ncbi:MAG: hypothetical protein SPL61_12010 [Saccharofermentans sp.]|nr:hypothetical protein [Saccharofermentans sp.]
MNILILFASVLALSGYFISYKRFTDWNTAFFPVSFISFSTVITYIFGLVGALKAGAILILILGIALLPITLLKSVNNKKINYLIYLSDPVILFFIICTIWSMIISRMHLLSDTDDLVHWYRICKILYADNAFPTNIDIYYTTYTPGTATWIYLFTKTFGFSVNNCFLGQSIINISACATFFSLIRKESKTLTKVIMILCISANSLLLCSIDTSTSTLRVDSIIALLSLSILIFGVNTGFSLNKKNVLFLLFTFSFLNSIKVSGILFQVFIIVVYLAKNKKFSDKLLNIRKSVIFFIPLLNPLLYRIRNTFIYKNINVGNQAISIERFSGIVNDKTADSIKTTVLDVFFNSFNPLSEFTQVNIGWICFLFLILCLIIFKSESKTIAKIIVYIGIVYFVFVLFLAFTYVFSMNSYEASILSCFYRYIGTVTIFITGITNYYLIDLFSKSRNKLHSKIIPIFIFSVFIAGNFMFDYSYIFTGNQCCSIYNIFIDDTPWRILSITAKENMEFTSEPYLVIYDDKYLENSNYRNTGILVEAFFRSPHSKAFLLSESDKYTDILKDYDKDHIILCCKDDSLKNKL